MSEHAWQSILEPRSAPTNVLVLGSSGMVGRAWVQLLRSSGIEFMAVCRPQFDLGDRASIESCMQGSYDLVVNAAAWTDVDAAESDEAGATRANAHAVQEIAVLSGAMGATLISYSTDYVFSGSASRPYVIDAPIEPINAYGRSKALGEALLRKATDRHLLIRTSWVYAPWGRNFALTMRGLMHQRDELRVVHDQRGRPSSAEELARGTLELFRSGAAGTWHLTDGGECTWFEFASEIRDALGSACQINPCTSDEFPRPARRPSYSTLDISASELVIGWQTPWEQRVRAALSQFEESA